MINLLLHENGLRFQNVYIYSKATFQSEYCFLNFRRLDIPLKWVKELIKYRFIATSLHLWLQLKPALEWEEEFIKFMKNYTENGMPAYMDIAYTSERSIEDELNRESKSDVYTILVSYFIMFAYIAISLGRFTTCSRLLIDSKVTLGLGGEWSPL